jgi:hypothetical protein
MHVFRGFFLGLLLGCAVLILPANGLAQTGTLQFFANGEELATEGFLPPKLTKDGWALTFSHIFVTLTDITAYQADPPFDAHSGDPISAKTQVALEGTHTVDLVLDAKEDSRVMVGEVKAPAGHYNAVSWKVTTAEEGILAGYSTVLIGKAQKDGKTVDFQLKSKEKSAYRCGEYVGDERKGFLAQGGMADLEMTFHLDHIFGRADKPADDEMNIQAAGFAPFADGKSHVLNLQGMHIGHAGEGHCSVEWH